MSWSASDESLAYTRPFGVIPIRGYLGVSIPTIVTDPDRFLMTEPVALVVNDDEGTMTNGDEDSLVDHNTEAEKEIVAGPDRADAPVSLVTERFLKVIVEHVPLQRLEELHLFSPLRQGGVETGIAVIAARAPEKDLPTLVDDEFQLSGDAEPEALAENVEPVRIRHTVFTARYRLTLKGPDRGKWESDVVAEADAPLITVEMVVRGVQRRAGEDSEILRFSAKQVAHAVQAPWPLPEIVSSRPETPPDAPPETH